MIFRVCAWCGVPLGVTDDGKAKESTSHGMCDPCSANLRSEAAATARSLNVEQGRCIHGRLPGEWCTSCESEK